MKVFLRIFIIITFLSSCAAKLTDNQRTNLKTDLEQLVTLDQTASSLPKGKYLDYTTEQWTKFRDSVHSNITTRIEGIFNQYGFLGYDKVGEQGSKHFWLLVQHSDKHPDFQKKVLAAMYKEVKKKHANPSDYAFLYDRVNVNAGEKQQFGTQLSYDDAGRPFAKIGLIDSVNVDKFRKAYDLEPLKDYYEFIINSRKH